MYIREAPEVCRCNTEIVHEVVQPLGEVVQPLVEQGNKYKESTGGLMNMEGVEVE